MSSSVPPVPETDIHWHGEAAPRELADAAQTLSLILADVEHYIRRYVVLSEHQSAAVTLWALHTHTIEAFEYTPYLRIGSATKRAGKTILLETLGAIVARPWLTGRTS